MGIVEKTFFPIAMLTSCCPASIPNATVPPLEIEIISTPSTKILNFLSENALLDSRLMPILHFSISAPLQKRLVYSLHPVHITVLVFPLIKWPVGYNALDG